jgi:tetratricopeptide (TPR) repeat protein
MENHTDSKHLKVIGRILFGLLIFPSALFGNSNGNFKKHDIDFYLNGTYEPYFYSSDGTHDYLAEDIRFIHMDMDTDLHEKNCAAYCKRAEAYIITGRLDEAISDYSEALRLDPKFEPAFNGRGNAYFLNHEYDKAISDYTNAIRIDPQFKIAYNGRANAWQFKKQYDKAIADNTEAIHIDPDYSNAFSDRGTAYQSKGDMENAVPDYSRSLNLNHSKLSYYYALYARYLVVCNYNDKALSSLEKSRLSGIKNAHYYLGYGAYYENTKRYDLAIKNYNEAFHFISATFPANKSMITRFRGHAYYDKGDYDNALLDFTEALRLNPEHPMNCSTIAWFLATCANAKYRNGKLATMYAFKACQLSAWKDPNIIDTLGSAYAESGDFSMAVDCEKKFLTSKWLSKNTLVKAKHRLSLYLAHQAYREQPGDF